MFNRASYFEMAKRKAAGLPHFDAGGTVQSPNSAVAPAASYQAPGSTSPGGSLVQDVGLGNDFVAQNPYAPAYLGTATANQGQTSAGQQGLAAQLQAQVAGQGPNPAQIQFNNNAANAAKNAQGLVSAQRGLNPEIATRTGVNAGTAATMDAAGKSAQLNQEQQIAATANLGNLYGQEQQGELGSQQLYGQQNTANESLNQNTAKGNANSSYQGVSGAVNGLSSLSGLLAEGGEIGPRSNLGKHLKSSKNMKTGGKVPGAAKVAGNSYANDTVKAMLSPKEIVLPRSVTMQPDAPAQAARFVAAMMAKNKGMRK